MKKLKRSILHAINRCISLIIPLLGLVPFHSCTTFTDMYGTPTIEFDINGRVENKLGKVISIVGCGGDRDPKKKTNKGNKTN